MLIDKTQQQLQIIEKIAGARVLVVGDVMLDRYWLGRASRLSPEAPVPVVGLENVRNIPGGAANVAANIAGLGAKVLLAGVIGSDDAGSALRSAVRASGIADEFLIASDTRKTTSKTRVLVHNQQTARIDDETVTPLTAEDEERLCYNINSVLDGVDAVVVSDYAKGCLTSGALTAAISGAKELDKPIIVDPKSKDLSKYNGSTLLTPNLHEALNAASFENATEENAGEAARVILDKTQIDSLLITLGEHGMMLFGRDGSEAHFPSMARQVFDVTGAGDTVVAVLGVALAAGADLHSAITLANLAAGIAVEKVGTSIVRADELRDAIHEQSLHMSMEQ